ncbi:hypothetical protein FJY68_00415 [candidate division WOR-3 bacterium]|uniref:Adhesin domain-containing protein n=1 Tax=candidate division WOR-3 bacterium TaxID=2052148 RepID=A0A938BNM1_UNCW3|nr:hypothetical protein [candidate division WOR-3 bacterium]
MESRVESPESRIQSSESRIIRRIALGLAVLVGVLAAGPMVVMRRIEKRVPLAGHTKAAVVHRYGDVTVIGTGGAHAVVDALVRVTARDRRLAEEFAGKVEIQAAGQGDSFVIATVYPSDVPFDPQLGYEVNMSIRMPAGVAALVRNSFGDVRVVGMDGDCRVVNRFGEVEMDRCDRSVVENSYGRVRLAQTRGLTVVRNSFGDVDLRLAGGPVQVTNRYGTVHTEQSTNDVTIDNQFGNVFARSDRGALSIANRYGDINAWVDDAELAALSIMSRLGRVNLSLGEQVPFRIDATARQGRIVSGLPFEVRSVGTAQEVSARQGAGGPQIDIQGVWSDLVIHGDVSDPAPDAPTVER